MVSNVYTGNQQKILHNVQHTDSIDTMDTLNIPTEPFTEISRHNNGMYIGTYVATVSI